MLILYKPCLFSICTLLSLLLHIVNVVFSPYFFFFFISRCIVGRFVCLGCGLAATLLTDRLPWAWFYGQVSISRSNL